MQDYHIHPNYSIDAEDYSMEEYCTKAVEVGLAEICFTPHYEFDPLRSHLDWFVRLKGSVVSLKEKWLEDYFREGERLKASYKPLGLQVKMGIEVGYDLGLERPIAAILEAFPFDFVLGSVHCVDHVAISSAKESSGYMPTISMEQMVEKYFNTVIDGLKSGLFDVLGHLDIYRRHGETFYGSKVYSAHLPYIQQVFELMMKKDIGMEINTSSFKQGQREFYPSRDIVSDAVGHGVRIFTTGSDAHRIGEIGNKMSEATTILANHNCIYASYDRRKVIL